MPISKQINFVLDRIRISVNHINDVKSKCNNKSYYYNDNSLKENLSFAQKEFYNIDRNLRNILYNLNRIENRIDNNMK